MDDTQLIMEHVEGLTSSIPSVMNFLPAKNKLSQQILSSTSEIVPILYAQLSLKLQKTLYPWHFEEHVGKCLNISPRSKWL